MKTTQRTRQLVGMAALAAIIIILQVAVLIPLGPFYITLTLVPLILGAILYGPAAGAILGAVFGVVVAIQVVTGAAGLPSFMMFELLPVITMALCVIKGAAAGWVAGLINKLLTSMNKSKLGIILATLICPIVNTGIFALGLFIFYGKLTSTWAVEGGFASTFAYVMVSMIGLNFLVEFAINVLLSPVVLRIITLVKRQIAR